ncbi:MAG: LpxL/LpxP family Kdo(2)-lipid IV(A) lauroyl/palmitoleoyl acyltransferase [Proteobacteria bacterium]|nr:LpxL/LpxP family Kdo(2)-lipid IV(A) lauroyl/palmitoleoyl acyltransferase [Pseudomonadota bacterium]
MRLRLLSPRYWPTWAGVGVLWLISLLPFRLLPPTGRALGAVLRRLPISFASTARRNIELCLPELGPRERGQLLRAHFASLGMALLEIPLAWWITPRRLAELVRIEGAEHIQAALARGRGVILLTAHFTTMEMAGRALASIIPVRFLYRRPKNEALAWALQRFRTKYGSAPIPKDDIRAFIATLKDNQCVWYAPDQSYRNKGAQMVPMFGIPAATNTLTSRLARMTGAAVLPYFLHRLPDGSGYRAVIHPPLADFPSDCPATDTARFNRMIEAQVRIAPEQYLWIHRRFKGLSQDYPDYYGQRAPHRG